jgi:gas vesicle protein
MARYENDEDERDERSEGGGGFGWFVAGLSLGALLGVLYAPKSGAETREELAQNARDGQEYLRRKGYEVRGQAVELVDRGKQQFDEFYEKGRQQFEEYVASGQAYYSKSREQVNEYVERGKDTVADQVNRVQAAVEAGKEAYRTTAATGVADDPSGSEN